LLEPILIILEIIHLNLSFARCGLSEDLFEHPKNFLTVASYLL
jgi:hypothetical protein